MWACATGGRRRVTDALTRFFGRVPWLGLTLLLSMFLLVPILGCRSHWQPAGQTQQLPHWQEQESVILTGDGYRLPYRRWGVDPPREPSMIFLGVHGFNDHSQAFAVLTEGLVNPLQARLYAYDQRGFGRAAHPGIWPGSATLVEDLRTVVSLLRQRYPNVPLLVIGESMGGAVALRASTEGRGLDLDALILLAPAVWGAQTMPWYQRLSLWLAQSLLPGATLTGAAAADLGIRVSDDPDVLRALRQDPLVIKQTRMDSLYGVTQLMSEALHHPVDFPQPTLVLYGFRDTIIPPGAVCAWVSQLATEDVLPTLQIALYPEGYHLLTRQRDAARVIEDLRSWSMQPGSRLDPLADSLEEAQREICALPKAGLRETRR